MRKAIHDMMHDDRETKKARTRCVLPQEAAVAAAARAVVVDPRPFPVAAQLWPHRVTTLNQEGIRSFGRGDWKTASTSFSKAIRIIERGEAYFIIDQVFHKDTAGMVAGAPKSSPKQRYEHCSCDDSSKSSSNSSGSSDSSSSNFNQEPAPRMRIPNANVPTDEYDEGMDCFQRPESWTASDVLTKDEMLASLHYNMGLAKLRDGDNQAALTAFQEAQTKSVVIGDMSSSYITKAYKMFRLLHKMAYVHYRTSNHVDAISYYHRALTLAMAASLDASLVAATLNCIAVIHFHRNTNDTSRTMELLQQSLKVYRECLGDKPTREVATVLNNMGRVHFLQLQYHQALQVYQEALSIREAVLGNNSIDVAATVYNTAQVHQQLGEKDQALELYHRFLKMMKARADKDHDSNATAVSYIDRDMATGCRCIADVYQERGELKRAIPFLQDALQLTKKIFGLFHAEVASILNKLGNLHYEVRDYATALIHYRDGLTVENAILPPNHPHIIVTLTNIAHILKQQRDYPGAALVYKKVLRKQRKTLGDSSIEVAAILSSLGLAQYHDGQYDEAFDSYQDALRIRRDHFESDDHLDIASTLNSIGLVLFKQQSLAVARSCFNASLRIRIKLLGPDHRDVAVLWYNLATVLFEMGQDDTSIRFYEETLRVERTSLGPDHADVVLTLQHLGQVHQQLGKLDEALDYFTQSLEIERRKATQKNNKDDDKNNVAVAKLLNLVGNIYMQQGNIDMMMKSFVEAARILESRRGHNEALLIAGYNHYGLSKLHPPCAPVA